MKDEEPDKGFLARWSRRKLRADQSEADAAASSDVGGAGPASAAEADAPEFDVSSLPTVESLGADSDYTGFMRQGVPTAMRLAALRKAWATDPVIRDYKTLADYDWDFNAPGYGALRSTDQPAEMARRLFQHLAPAEEDGRAVPAAHEQIGPEEKPPQAENASGDEAGDGCDDGRHGLASDTDEVEATERITSAG